MAALQQVHHRSCQQGSFAMATIPARSLPRIPRGRASFAVHQPTPDLDPNCPRHGHLATQQPQSARSLHFKCAASNQSQVPISILEARRAASPRPAAFQAIGDKPPACTLETRDILSQLGSTLPQPCSVPPYRDPAFLSRPFPPLTCVRLLMTSISCSVTTCTTSFRFCSSPSGHCTNLVEGPARRWRRVTAVVRGAGGGN